MSTAKLKKVEGSFSERLKMLRKVRGWSQEDLAARLDVSPGSVGNWEMGPHEPHPKTLSKVAALFEVDVNFLLNGEEPVMMRERAPEYRTVDLAGILREVEDARGRLDRIAQQLRKATTKPSAAALLTEAAGASYEQKHGGGKDRAKEGSDIDSIRIDTGAEKKSVPS
jgi:transcriptional regulator with XRE-family HTH domain